MGHRVTEDSLGGDKKTQVSFANLGHPLYCYGRINRF